MNDWYQRNNGGNLSRDSPLFFSKMKQTGLEVVEVKLHEAEKELDTSRTTLYRWRKKLGILDETKTEVSETHMKQLRALAKERVKRQISKEHRANVLVEAEQSDDFAYALQLQTGDSDETKALKVQYNGNLKVLAVIQNRIDLKLLCGEIPDKYLVDMLEKFQNMNIRIIKVLGKKLGSGDEQEELLQALGIGT